MMSLLAWHAEPRPKVSVVGPMIAVYLSFGDIDIYIHILYLIYSTYICIIHHVTVHVTLSSTEGQIILSCYLRTCDAH